MTSIFLSWLCKKSASPSKNGMSARAKWAAAMSGLGGTLSLVRVVFACVGNEIVRNFRVLL
jgi:hypothetical protein